MFLFNNHDIVLRLKKYPIFNQFSLFTLNRLVSQSELITVPEDTVLFYSQTPSDNVYYVIDGTIDLFLTPSFDRIIGHARGGEMLGETSMLADEPHGLTARTSRPSHLLKISKHIFLKFFQKDPEPLMQLTKITAKHLRRMITGLATEHYPYKNILLFNLTPNANISHFKHYFQECSLQDNTKIYDKNDFEISKQDLVPFLHQCENTLGVNLFLAQPSDHVWDKSILLHVEYVYLIVPENDMPLIPEEVLEILQSLPCDVVIWHEKPEPYSQTAQFYQYHAFKRHHHFRNEKKYYQRLFRFMTGQAIGLVISAGGFRGYALYGLVKALLESNVPIDCIGGSSIGAAIGAGLAESFSWETFHLLYEKTIGSLKQRKFSEFSFPVTSLLSGKIPTQLLQATFSERYIEDMPINFFCITGNLSTRQKEVKNQGKCWEWLRASVAVPGMFPPFVKNGNVYVDGAVCTTLPIKDMRHYLDNAGKIICMDVRLQLNLTNSHAYICPPTLNFFEALAYRCGFLRKKYCLPKVFDILVESASIDQYAYDAEWEKNADIILAPDTSALSFSNPSVGDPLSLISYTYAKEKLKEYEAVYARWLL